MSNATREAEQPKQPQTEEEKQPKQPQTEEEKQPQTEEEKQPQTEEEKQPQPQTWTKFAPVSSVLEDEPYIAPEIRTELPLPARPFVKGGFALAFSGGVLVMVAIFFQLASGIGWNQEKQSSEQPENQSATRKPTSEMTAQEKLQWCLATRKCGEIEEPSKNATLTARTNPNATAQRKKHPVLAARPPTRPQVSYNTAQEVSRPVQIQHYEEPPVSPHPVVSTLPVAQPAPQPVSPQQPSPDPIALLAQASNMGTYTTSGVTSPSPDSSPASSGSNRLVADRRLVNARVDSALVNPQPTIQPTTSLQPGKVIPVTTRIKATVVTTTTWMGSSTEQKFLIQTDSDAPSLDGSIAIPKGTYLLSKVSQANSSGYVDLKILSVQMYGQEKAIPSEAIIVQGKGGEPIRAKVKNKEGGGGGGLGRMFLAAGLAGVGEAANSTNSAKIFLGNTTTITSGSNIGAGVVKGVADSLSQQISGQVKQTTRSSTSNQPVLVLKSGTKLELIINQPLTV